jgi:hypothetical protein
MFKLNSKTHNFLVSGFQSVLKEYRWMFFIFVIWAITYIALSEGILTKQSSITVSGSSVNAVRNEIAKFNLNIDTLNSDKAKAIEETNTKGSVIIDAIKNFGISEDDIQTVNMNVYQQDKFENGTYVKGDWYAGMGIEVTVKDVSKAASFSDLMSSLDISSFYGPSFTVDTTNVDDTDPLKMALEDAHDKAVVIARAMNKKLGEVIYFVESGSSYGGTPFMYSMKDGMGGGGGAEMLPGTTDTYKSVTVTYELK